MARTTIDIDDELIERAMERLPPFDQARGCRLRGAALGRADAREEALAMEGQGWDGEDELIWGTQEVATDLAIPDRPRPR